ncbi:MAG: RDD family protein [Thermoanaerobaculia bacterium]
MTDPGQTKLLRIAAFLIDALITSITLVLPASAASYAMTWTGTPRYIQLVWWIALGVLVISILLRDGFRGRSIGKQLLGLRLITPHGERCGYFRSIVRNLPIIIPGWNLLEAILIVAGRPRTGDRIARTSVTEE